MTKQKVASVSITLISIAVIVGVFFIKPIPQDLAYHNFIDNKDMIGIPHFWNVMSNVPFLIVGVMALMQFKKLKIIAEMGIAYRLLFFGIALVAFGSGYYHLNPDNHTLVWDRLPMTIAFMSLFAIIISEFIDARLGAILLFPLILVGVASVFYWQWSELNGMGDLRFYALVQFLPILLIPIMLLMYSSKYSHISGYWWLLLFYVAAKALEYYDSQVFELLGGLLSGHSIKHVAAALGTYMLLLSYKKRSRVIKH